MYCRVIEWSVILAFALGKKGDRLTTIDKDSIRDVLISSHKIDILFDEFKKVLNSYSRYGRCKG